MVYGKSGFGFSEVNCFFSVNITANVNRELFFLIYCIIIYYLPINLFKDGETDEIIN